MVKPVSEHIKEDKHVKDDKTGQYKTADGVSNSLVVFV
jgi:hypothetical protein